ncbi:MAG: metallopeptidase family protein [Candidatus Scalindua sp.]|nr:metallopeptidase family protein [Candidatus Scalindua sp.]
MSNESRFIKCFNCGQTHRLGDYDYNTDIVCTCCGKEIEPVIFDKVCEADKRGFYTLLGYFSIVGILGAMGGAMMSHGWNFFLTFLLLGGVVYLVGKIFMSKYRIIEVEEYLSGKIENNNADMHSSGSFDRLVVASINELPQDIRTRLEDVSIVVEEIPNPFVLGRLKLKSNRLLLGLFQGVPLNRKSVWHATTMPEKITLYQKNIESICHSEEDIKHRIKKVVRHEVAHFVGFTEEQIRGMGY